MWDNHQSSLIKHPSILCIIGVWIRELKSSTEMRTANTVISTHLIVESLCKMMLLDLAFWTQVSVYFLQLCTFSLCNYVHSVLVTDRIVCPHIKYVIASKIVCNIEINPVTEDCCWYGVSCFRVISQATNSLIWELEPCFAFLSLFLTCHTYALRQNGI